MSTSTEWKRARKRSIHNREFLVAVYDNEFEEINRLLDGGADINFKDADGQTPLSLAAEYGDCKVVQVLLDRGASLEIKTANNETPLDIAKRLNRSKIVKILGKSSKLNLKPEILDDTEASSPLQSQKQNGIQSAIDNNQNAAWNNAVHGNIYQLKLLMLFLYRGVTCMYSFRLGTEIKEAKKFNDLVFEYTQDNTKFYRLLQAKHKIDETKKITVHKLLSEPNGDYSLVKYFHSYQVCKRNNFFKDGFIKDVTICTNIDFDFKNLEKAGIEIVHFEEKDNILDVGSRSKISTKYKFTKNIVSKLRQKLLHKTKTSISGSIDVDIEDFLDHLVFAVNQPNERELGEIIKKEIGRETDPATTEAMYNKFFIRMLDCFKGRSNFMSFIEGKKFFEEFKKSLFIWFNVHEPVKSFTGRLELIKNIHDLLQAQESRLLCISGLGGVGKSELVKKYISEFSECYDNKIVWINAESYQTLVNSFYQLASDKLDISTINMDGKAKDVNSVISQIYHYFSKSKSLFIFDNAEMYRSSDELDSGISRFLPSLPSVCHKPYIIITSRNKKWPESVKVKVLDGFTEDEAVTFVSQSLHLEIDKHEEQAKQLVLKLQLLPLALQQAVAYIKFQNEDLDDAKKGFEISDYLKRFEGKSDEILNFVFPDYSDNLYSKTVFTTWNITFDDIKRKENGYYALNLLNIIAYLLPNDIFEETLMNFILNEEKLESTIELLKQYSLIEIQNGMMNVHRLVQQVTRMKLVESNQEKDILDRCLNAMDKNIVNSKNIGHFLCIWTHCRKHSALFKEHIFRSTILAGVLISCGRSEEAHLIGTEAIEILQESSSKDLEAQNLLSIIKHQNAGALSEQGKYNEALNEFKQSYEDHKASKGPYHEMTLSAKGNMAGALICLGRINESFELYKEVFKDSTIHLGENHSTTLHAGNNVAVGLMNQDKYEESLELAQAVYAKEKVVFGNYHEKTLTTKQNIAGALKSLKKYEEALNIYQEIYDYQNINLVENHPDTLHSKVSIASMLYEQGNFKAALQFYEDVFALYKKIYGENHPKTLEIHSCMAFALIKLNEFQEALQILRVVLIKQKGLLGLHHPDVEYTLSGLMLIFEVQGKDKEALKIHEELLRCRIALFGVNDIRTLKCRGVISIALVNAQKYDAALKQFEQMYQIQKDSFGTNHPSTLMSKHQIGMMYFYKKQYDKALSILTEVCKAQEAVLGKNDTVCINTRYNINIIVLEQQTYKLQQQLNVPAETITDPIEALKKVRALEKLMNETADIDMKDINKGKIVHFHTANLGVLPVTITNPIEAVKGNNLIVLEKLIKEGADVNMEDANKGTLLHHAVNLGLTDIITFLLKSGADVTRTTTKGNTPLHMATSKGDFEIVKALLENINHEKLQEFINAKTLKSGSSALHIAAKNGFLEITKHLLSRGAKYNLKSNENQLSVDLATDRYVKDTLKTVDKLFELASTGKEELVNMLQQYPVDKYLAHVNARNSKGYNLLQVVVLKNNEDLINSFHELRCQQFLNIYVTLVPDINLDEFFSLASTALLSTFQQAKYSLEQVLEQVRDFVQMFRVYFNCTFNLNVAVIEDMLVLLNSSKSKLEFAQLAIKVIADHLAQFMFSIDSTKLLKATKLNDLTEVEKLVSKHLNIDVQDDAGWTPLHHATNVNNERMVAILLSRGAQLHITKTGKYTPLHIAVNKGNITIVNFLLNCNLSMELIDAKTKAKGSTALHIAVKNGQFNIVKGLFSYCANYQLKNKDGQRPADLINNEDIRNLFKIVDELFADVTKGNNKVIKKLKALSTGMLMTVVRVRNDAGYALMEVAALNKHLKIATVIHQMVEAVIEQAKISEKRILLLD